MSTLRRLLPTLAALLVVSVVVQVTDLIACADEAETATHQGETRVDGTAQGGHPVPAPSNSHDDTDHEGMFADCLCHIVFTPTTVVPTLGARPALERSDFAVAVAAIPDVEPTGLDHVPLG